MKRAPIVLFAFVLLVLYGCGGSTAAPTNTPVPAPPSATPAPAASATSPASAPTATVAGAAPTATSGETGPAATATPVAAGATATTTALVMDVPTASPPPSATLTLTPPALPAAGTFSGTPGPSADNAVAVTVPLSITGKLASADSEQWYKFDLSQYANGGVLSMDFTAASAADSAQEFRIDGANGDEFTREDLEAGQSKHDDQELKAGVYLLRVAGGVDAQNPYQASLTFHPNSDHADQAHAVPLGLAGTVTGWLNSTSDAQWFAVDMSKYPQGGNLTASLTVPAQAGSQYRVRIVDASGTNEINSAAVDQGTTDSASVETATATNYYIVVESRGGADYVHPYTLAVNFTPHSPYNSAKAALTVTPPVLLRLWLPAPNDVTYFSFQVAGAANVTANLTIPADGNPTSAEFFDGSGQNSFGGTGTINPGAQGTASGTLRAGGTYLLAVTRRDGEAISSSPTTVELRIEATTP